MYCFSLFVFISFWKRLVRWSTELTADSGTHHLCIIYLYILETLSSIPICLSTKRNGPRRTQRGARNQEEPKGDLGKQQEKQTHNAKTNKNKHTTQRNRKRGETKGREGRSKEEEEPEEERGRGRRRKAPRGGTQEGQASNAIYIFSFPFVYPPRETDPRGPNGGPGTRRSPRVTRENNKKNKHTTQTKTKTNTQRNRKRGERKGREGRSKEEEEPEEERGRGRRRKAPNGRNAGGPSFPFVYPPRETDPRGPNGGLGTRRSPRMTRENNNKNKHTTQTKTKTNTRRNRKRWERKGREGRRGGGRRRGEEPRRAKRGATKEPNKKVASGAIFCMDATESKCSRAPRWRMSGREQVKTTKTRKAARASQDPPHRGAPRARRMVPAGEEHEWGTTQTQLNKREKTTKQMFLAG